jgi:hypothetical protein
MITTDQRRWQRRSKEAVGASQPTPPFKAQREELARGNGFLASNADPPYITGTFPHVNGGEKTG